jgi:hypothetical protein
MQHLWQAIIYMLAVQLETSRPFMCYSSTLSATTGQFPTTADLHSTITAAGLDEQSTGGQRCLRQCSRHDCLAEVCSEQITSWLRSVDLRWAACARRKVVREARATARVKVPRKPPPLLVRERSLAMHDAINKVTIVLTSICPCVCSRSMIDPAFECACSQMSN